RASRRPRVQFPTNPGTAAARSRSDGRGGPDEHKAELGREVYAQPNRPRGCRSGRDALEAPPHRPASRDPPSPRSRGEDWGEGPTPANEVNEWAFSSRAI